MAYPTQEELVSAEPLLDWIDSHFLRHDPFAFQENFRDISTLITAEFGVDPNAIFCIGSGAIGLSINPDKILNGILKPFNTASDIDLAFISEVHFEQAWRDLRAASQPTLAEISDLVRNNLKWQKKRFFDGAILANKLLPELSFGREWLASEVRLAQEISVALDREIDVNYWIYRDYWSLRNYVATGVMNCRRELI